MDERTLRFYPDPPSLLCELPESPILELIVEGDRLFALTPLAFYEIFKDGTYFRVTKEEAMTPTLSSVIARISEFKQRFGHEPQRVRISEEMNRRLLLEAQTLFDSKVLPPESGAFVGLAGCEVVVDPTCPLTAFTIERSDPTLTLLCDGPPQE